MKSDVIFIPVQAKDPATRAACLEKLLKTIPPWGSFKKDVLVPVKITIGDASCVYHLRPDLVKVVIDALRAQGAKPFLFDTSVIYKGSRQNAVDHLTLAHAKGFHQAGVGAPFIVADGLWGQDGKDFSVDAQHIKRVKTPSFVGVCESLVVLSHATGHVFSGFAGAIKNVAMGMSCRATKQVQHSSMKPCVDAAQCTGCGCCARICPVNAIAFDAKGKARIDAEICVGCGECLCACQFDAVCVNWDEEMDVFCARMDEVAHFILSKFKNKLFITFAFDITQECDCISTKDDRLISGDVGILASADPLALDKATADLMSDEFRFLKEHSAYQHMFTYAEKIGLGSLDYRLIKI
jgi:uncharacterized Fe-S center protein